MKERLIIERQGGKNTIRIWNYLIIHGSYVRVPDKKRPRQLKWINAEACNLKSDEITDEEGKVWIEDVNGDFVGVFNTTEEYIKDLEEFFGKKNIKVKKRTIISP